MTAMEGRERFATARSLRVAVTPVHGGEVTGADHHSWDHYAGAYRFEEAGMEGGPLPPPPTPADAANRIPAPALRPMPTDASRAR